MARDTRWARPLTTVETVLTSCLLRTDNLYMADATSPAPTTTDHAAVAAGIFPYLDAAALNGLAAEFLRDSAIQSIALDGRAYHVTATDHASRTVQVDNVHVTLRDLEHIHSLDATRFGTDAAACALCAHETARQDAVRAADEAAEQAADTTAPAGADVPEYRARKGDVAVVVLTRTTTGADSTRTTTRQLAVGIVAAATRDGLVAKASWDHNPDHDPTDQWSRPFRHTDHAPIPGRALTAGQRGTPITQVLCVHRARVADRDGLLAALTGRRFDNADQVRDAIRPYLHPQEGR